MLFFSWTACPHSVRESLRKDSRNLRGWMPRYKLFRTLQARVALILAVLNGIVVRLIRMAGIFSAQCTGSSAWNCQLSGSL
jgi:hypothetical protein